MEEEEATDALQRGPIEFNRVTIPRGALVADDASLRASLSLSLYTKAGIATCSMPAPLADLVISTRSPAAYCTVHAPAGLCRHLYLYLLTSWPPTHVEGDERWQPFAR